MKYQPITNLIVEIIMGGFYFENCHIHSKNLLIWKLIYSFSGRLRVVLGVDILCNSWGDNFFFE